MKYNIHILTITRLIVQKSFSDSADTNPREGGTAANDDTSAHAQHTITTFIMIFKEQESSNFWFQHFKFGKKPLRLSLPE